ncbi:hypothetical protein TRFO_15182 [Tritrichomonas foetus]|uniref:PCI domain-containing protein n=1 Tax=Tritrichomonas foetus TaxID=1144522 RepID=A0A1J4KSY4_9EUKA|nr:hypothetical protein TRFO_15182 [Tritrichomonas foetus]|eukprot:OHT14407.1 hypothetical protein TRFO_15182 [Tritrichomonas foetus]
MNHFKSKYRYDWSNKRSIVFNKPMNFNFFQNEKMDDDNITPWQYMEQDGQIVYSDSFNEEENIPTLELEDENYSISLKNSQNSSKIDFSSFNECIETRNFKKALKVIDDIIQICYQKCIFDDNFGNKILECCQILNNDANQTETDSINDENENEQAVKDFLLLISNMKIRLAFFYLFSFLLTNKITYVEKFLPIISELDFLFQKKDSDFYDLQKYLCVLNSTYLVASRFNALESISEAISWASYDENYDFSQEKYFAPYLCLADAVKSFNRRIYKQAVNRSFQSFELFPPEISSMRKKCLVLYFFTSLFITNEITKEKSDLLITDESVKNDADLIPFLEFINLHQKCDFLTSRNQIHDFSEKVSNSFDFLRRSRFDEIPNVIRRRAIMKSFIIYRRVSTNFITNKFSFNSNEETMKTLFEMIRRKEICHFYNDRNDTFEIVDSAHQNDESLKNEKDEYEILSNTTNVVNEFINTFM